MDRCSGHCIGDGLPSHSAAPLQCVERSLQHSQLPTRIAAVAQRWILSHVSAQWRKRGQVRVTQIRSETHASVVRSPTAHDKQQPSCSCRNAASSTSSTSICQETAGPAARRPCSSCMASPPPAWTSRALSSGTCCRNSPASSHWITRVAAASVQPCLAECLHVAGTDIAWCL